MRCDFSHWQLVSIKNDLQSRSWQNVLVKLLSVNCNFFGPRNPSLRMDSTEFHSIDKCSCCCCKLFFHLSYQIYIFMYQVPFNGVCNSSTSTPGLKNNCTSLASVWYVHVATKLCNADKLSRGRTPCSSQTLFPWSCSVNCDLNLDHFVSSMEINSHL